ncbi:MAG TPA: two-component regulator propeller domain-containing protein, partial [Blastocatellia bacterium]|nr:two-component regulator propeller domain-containing protein [Blastocatellia bacterium]
MRSSPRLKSPLLPFSFIKVVVTLILSSVIFLGVGSILEVSSASHESTSNGDGESKIQYRIDSWNTDDGIPQTAINKVLQTRDGFIWLATFGGPVRYDGESFRVFNPGNTPGLSTSRIVRMFEDPTGNLWLTTEDQGIIREKDGLFYSYTTSDGLPSNQVLMTYSSADGNAVIVTEKGSVEWRQGRFVTYLTDSSFPTQNVFNLKENSSVVWFRDNTGSHKYENGQIIADLPITISALRIQEGPKDCFWIETTNHTLLRYQSGHVTDFSSTFGFKQIFLISLLEDNQGTVWLGISGDSGGLYRVAGDKLLRYGVADGLASNDVHDIIQDREGAIWVATAQGLSRVTRKIVTAYSTRDGLAGDNVYPICQTKNGDVWIGSWFGLTRYRNGKLENVGVEYKMTTERVFSLYEDREGGLWIGGWGGGVRRFKDGQMTLLSQIDAPGNVVRVIYQDRSGEMWFGGPMGLTKLSNGVTTLYTRQDGLAGQEVLVITEDHNGDLLIGTVNGLTRYHGGVFTSYGEKEGLPQSIVRAIYEDGDGVLWLGTYDSGLYRYKDGKATRYTTQQGLFDNGVFRILEDRHGALWMTCNLGIYRVSKNALNDVASGRSNTVTSISYGKRDGMLNAECNGGGQPAGIIALDGRLWFPTQHGVATIDPDAVPRNDQPPPVVIEELLIDNKSASFNQPVRVLPGQDAIEIHYAGLSLSRPELVRFKYKLAGIDDDWVEAGSRRTAYYTHLPPGTYPFTVLAANRDGVWSAQGATIQITIVPPFWRTWWFLSLCVGTLIALGFFLYKIRIRALKREHAIREEYSRRLIDSQELDRKRIAAELHDSLSQSLIVMKNWALLGISSVPDNEVAKKRLAEISTTASQALGEVREIAYNLSPYQIDRLGLRQTILEMINKVSDSAAIKFGSDIETIDGLLSKEAEIGLYRIVQESINNIVKHSGASEANISIKPDTHWLVSQIS